MGIADRDYMRKRPEPKGRVPLVLLPACGKQAWQMRERPATPALPGARTSMRVRSNTDPLESLLTVGSTLLITARISSEQDGPSKDFRAPGREFQGAAACRDLGLRVRP